VFDVEGMFPIKTSRPILAVVDPRVLENSYVHAIAIPLLIN